MASRCSSCGSTAEPFSNVEGLFTVLMCADCQPARGLGSGPPTCGCCSSCAASHSTQPRPSSREVMRQPNLSSPPRNIRHTELTPGTFPPALGRRHSCQFLLQDDTGRVFQGAIYRLINDLIIT
jgi:hypothetical protein